MTSLTVTAKGQITLRKDLLAHLGSRPGDRLNVQKLPDGRIEVSAMRPKRKIEESFGALKRPGQPRATIEQLNEIIADSWAGKR